MRALPLAPVALVRAKPCALPRRLAKNARVQALAQPLIEQSAQAFLQTRAKQRLFCEVHLRRRHLGSGAAGAGQGRAYRPGEQSAFVVTKSCRGAQVLYDEVYCARGEMETGSRNSNWIVCRPDQFAAAGGPISSGCS